MKYLIVNADDFGYSPSVNRGIIEAHKNGIVTSTSVMVDSIAANEARGLTAFPNLSVGLHLVPDEFSEIVQELDRQVEKFVSIYGDTPTHIDIHKVRHEDIELKEAVNAYAKAKGMSARYMGLTNFISTYFGPHADGDVSINQLKKSIDSINEGRNELMCHVGYSDIYLREHSSYNDMREEELKSLCSAEIRDYIDAKGIELINWAQHKTNQL